MDKTILKNIILPMILGVGIYFLIVFIFHPFVISGGSMEPTFYENDVVLCKPLKDSPIEYGDIVVSKDNSYWRKVIKRVVGLPGDELYIKDGLLYVNNELSNYQFGYIEESGILEHSLKLNDNEYFLLGDNRNRSRDCRDYGQVLRRDIKFKVTKVFKLGGVNNEH